MDSRAGGRLALTIAAAFLFAATTTRPLQACENCPPGEPYLASQAANALPIYPETTEEVAPPVSLKKFIRSQPRSARRTQPRKASLAERANASRYASRSAKPAEGVGQTEAPARVTSAAKPLSWLVNAKAELIEADTTKAGIADASSLATPAAEVQDRPEAPQPPVIELVSADEFNELDRAAWEANQMPKLMKLTASDSRAELRDDDSKWAQTSTIGKLFVAFGALLTFGSAIRMFMA